MNNVNPKPAATTPQQPLLTIEDLSLSFETSQKGVVLEALQKVALVVNASQTVCIVGESGCGKSLTSLAIMGLTPTNALKPTGTVWFQTKDNKRVELLSLPERELRKLRGREIAMIFQDPMTSLNPAFTVEFQLCEAIQTHSNVKLSKTQLREKAIAALDAVGIPAPADRLKAYPFQLSGGMSQRVMIAIALAGDPKILIADEPTTALDVTIQAQILTLLKNLQTSRKMGLILITHDLGVVAEMADFVNVMYAGQIVESGSAADVLHNPRHPYTQALLNSLPALQMTKTNERRLESIPGVVPHLAARPSGCEFHPRCLYKTTVCVAGHPALKAISNDHAARCFKTEGKL